jgi:hypothetical protein
MIHKEIFWDKNQDLRNSMLNLIPGRITYSWVADFIVTYLRFVRLEEN